MTNSLKYIPVGRGTAGSREWWVATARVDEQIQLNNVTQCIEDYLRLVLQKFIVLSIKYQHQSIVSILDESLIDVTKRKHLKVN